MRKLARVNFQVWRKSRGYSHEEEIAQAPRTARAAAVDLAVGAGDEPIQRTDEGGVGAGRPQPRQIGAGGLIKLQQRGEVVGRSAARPAAVKLVDNRLQPLPARPALMRARRQDS